MNEFCDFFEKFEHGILTQYSMDIKDLFITLSDYLMEREFVEEN